MEKKFNLKNLKKSLVIAGTMLLAGTAVGESTEARNTTDIATGEKKTADINADTGSNYENMAPEKDLSVENLDGGPLENPQDTVKQIGTGFGVGENQGYFSKKSATELGITTPAVLPVKERGTGSEISLKARLRHGGDIWIWDGGKNNKGSDTYWLFKINIGNDDDIIVEELEKYPGVLFIKTIIKNGVKTLGCYNASFVVFEKDADINSGNKKDADINSGNKVESAENSPQSILKEMMADSDGAGLTWKWRQTGYYNNIFWEGTDVNINFVNFKGSNGLMYYAELLPDGRLVNARMGVPDSKDFTQIGVINNY